MLIAEYDYDEDIQVKQEEAREEGVKIGERRGVKRGIGRGILLSGEIFQAIRKNPDFIDAKIAKDVGCTIEDVKNVRKMFAI